MLLCTAKKIRIRYIPIIKLRRLVPNFYIRLFIHLRAGSVHLFRCSQSRIAHRYTNVVIGTEAAHFCIFWGNIFFQFSLQYLCSVRNNTYVITWSLVRNPVSVRNTFLNLRYVAENIRVYLSKVNHLTQVSL
jgi:hypothetical protein